MEKQILLAVDDSSPSKRAIKYAVDLAATIEDLHYVLFHVQPMVSLFLKEEARRSVIAKSKHDKIIQKNEADAQRLLHAYKNEMVAAGIDPERIKTVSMTRKLGFAKDIIEYAQLVKYDAIVVGRRGLAGLIRMYSGSVTTDILEQSQLIPVWLIDGEAAAGEILLAADGSESAFRALDHVSFILSGNPKARLTVLHIENSARNQCSIDLDENPDPELEQIVIQGDKACIDQFYSHALNKLNSAGITGDRVRFETVSGKRRIARAILEYAQKENLSTVVIGRRGLNKSFFMGSVSRFMINKLENGALWVVP